jgi:peroxiredoxin
MKILILLALIIFPFLLSAQGNFEIKGKVGNWNAPAKVYLVYMVGGNKILDSSAIANGVFMIKGTIPEYIFAWLILDRDGKGFNQLDAGTDYMGIYLANETIIVTSKDSMKSIVVGSSAINDDGVRYYSFLNKGMAKMNALTAEWATIPLEKLGEPVFQEGWKKKMVAANEEATEVKKQWIRQNTHSYFSLLSLTDLANEKYNAAVLDSLYTILSPNLRTGKEGQQLKKTIETLRNISIGETTPVFTQPDKDGKPVTPDQYKGKYLLIDFWSSWCMPCRMENINLVNTYTKYHPKGFEVLGVSLDDSSLKDAWLKAIKDDRLEWTHVSDLKGWKNEAAQLYGIKSVPQNFLIDPDGIIVATNLYGQDLNNKLDEILKK